MEVLLGGSVVASTATDEFGRYEIEPLAAGDYVLCAERTAYNSEVTDLQMYSLEPILLSMELDPLGAATLPDLVLTSQDITYTVLQSGAVEVTAMVENAGLAASDVAVRFLAEHVSEGYGEPVSMGTDQLIASLGQGQAEAATVTWTPLSGYDRYHVIVDPENQITESVEINNAAYRNLGEVGRVPPEILSVTAQWDGIESDLVIGQFMSGVLGQDNTFTAEVVDPDGDISHVEFQFGDQTPLTDSYATGGWTVELDVGEFPGDNILLEVIAYDEAGLASDPFVVTVDMREMPVWMNTYLKLSDTPLDWPVGFSVEGGYFHETFSFDAGTSAGDVFDYIVSLDDVIVLIGSTTSEMKGNVEVDIGIPLSPALPPTIRGVFRIEEKLMDQTLDAEEVTLVLELDPDWNLTGISTSWGRDFPLASWEIETTIPIPAFPAIHVLLAIGADFSAGLDLTLACTNNFESFSASFTPSVEAAIHGTVGLTDPFKFARIEGVISPTLVLDYTLTYVDPDEVHHTTSGVFRVDWTVRGCILWGLCHDFASGTMGPWDIWDEEFGEGMEIPLAEPSVPDLLAYPSLRAGPAGELGMVWIADADPDPLHVDPEVQFTYEDTLGEWSAPIPVTGGGTTDGWFQTSPVIAWGPGGEAVSVWVQNSFTESQALSRSPTFSEALDHQDLWWSRWDGVSWSAPASLHADTPGGEKADGVPSLDISPVGDQGLCVWARSVGDSALLDGISEVFYSIYSGDAWGTAERLTDNTQDDVGPDVSFGSDGKALGVWLREVENLHGHNQVLSSLWDGVTWSEPDFLGGNGEVNHDPTVTHLPNGDGVASWVARQIDPEDSTAVYTVYAARWDQTSGVWNDPETVHSDSLFMESTIVRSDARNIACITWRGHDGYDGDLFASMKDMDDPQSTWTLPHQLTDDDYTDWMVAGDVDDQNNLRFVDLKTDLADVTGNPNRGEFFDGMSLVSRGIGADLTFGDDLNFGFHPISADLKVSAMAVSDTLPSEGQTVTVTALVENIGDVLSSGTTVSFWSAHPDSGGAQIGSAVALAEVYPDSSAEVQTDWVAGTGTHELWAWVDPDGLVDEQTESNNRGSVSVDIFPDLVATEVYAVSDNPEPGDWVTVFGVVENVGGTAATDVLVRFLAGGDTLAAAQIPMLLPAKAETLTSIWQAAEGANELLISVDSDSLIPEWIDDNNQMSGLLKVLPDLMLSAETLDVSEHSDTHLVVTATLSNTGGVVADSVTVRFYDGDPLAGGTLKADTMVVSLDAFSEVELERQIAFDAGVLRLYVVADGDGEIEERDENNNRSYGRFVFTEVPDLSITPEDIHVVDYSGPGLPFWIEAHVTNLGGADVTAVRVHFYDGHPDTAGVYLGGRIIPTVPQDSTRVALFEWAVADLEHVLYVHVDGDSLIEELDEANNLAGVSLEQAVHVPEDPVSYLTALHPSVPNPFGASTELHYSLSHPCEVSLKVFDVAGRLVAVLEDGWREAGHHHRKWDGRNLSGHEVASGVYFSRLQAEGTTLESKIVVVR